MISHAAFISLIYYKSSYIYEIHFARISCFSLRIFFPFDRIKTLLRSDKNQILHESNRSISF